MDTDLLSRILREARDAAPNPAAAMAIEDLTRDLLALADAGREKGCEDFDDMAFYVNSRKGPYNGRP